MTTGRPGSSAAVVLLDRDGTLIENVPHNADPARVVPCDGAREALDRLRAAGIMTAVVTNQSVIGRGWATVEQVDATNARVEELLGPLGPVFVCPHAPQDGCRCRKPRPGLILDALAHFGVDPSRVTVIGDMGSDLTAAEAAGVKGILVPSAETPPADVAAATLRDQRVSDILAAAQRVVLDEAAGRPGRASAR